MPKRTLLSLNISSLTLDPRNARKHSDHDVQAIAASLQQFSQQTPIVVSSDNVVIKGNGTLLAAQSLGWKRIDAVRTELTGEQVTAYSIADNQTGLLSEWDNELLLELLQGFDDDALVNACGFDEAALAALIEEVTPDIPPEINEDEVPELPVEPVTKLGDLWLLGRHRLLCGDSTKADDVGRLMNGEKADMVFTDPPYGVGYDGGTTVREKLAGDDTTALYEPACKMAALHTTSTASLYLWHAGVKGIAAAAAAAAAGYIIRCEIVWNKNQAQFGALSAQYKQKHEPCYYCYKKGKTVDWCGPTNEVTVWDVDRSSVNEYHPTQKPVALAARALNNHRAESVLDLFLGSGSTLIAAEQMNRKCYGMELSPQYVDVIVKRWENLTGQKAILDD